MEIITKEGEKINRYTPSEDQDKKEILSLPRFNSDYISAV